MAAGGAVATTRRIARCARALRRSPRSGCNRLAGRSDSPDAHLSRSARRALRGQRGPTGPQGPAGAAGAAGQNGAPGQTGQRGPSDAWTVNQTGQANGASVPAGSYVAAGNVYMSSSSSPSCTLWHTTGGGGASGRISFAPGSASAYTMPVDDTFTVRETSTVYLDCTGVTGTAIPQVAVLQVATLH